MATYYKVNDSDTGAPRLLFRQNDNGSLARYVGGGDWVIDGYVARWLGPGGDSHDGVVPEADLPAVKAAVDIRWGKGPDA